MGRLPLVSQAAAIGFLSFVAGGAVFAQPLDPLAPPTFGYGGGWRDREVPMRESTKVVVRAGGTVDVSDWGRAPNCRGWTKSQPDYRFDLARARAFLHVWVSAAGGDTTLIVNAVGRWYCSDDWGETQNPSLEFNDAGEGPYAIWVGSKVPRRLVDATLEIQDTREGPLPTPAVPRRGTIPVLAAFRAVHIAAGCIALLLFWIPLVVRKGATVHRRVGWIYALAMAVVVASAWVICGLRLSDADPHNDAGSIFLAFIAFLSGSAAYTGIRIQRTKTRTGPHRKPIDLAAPITLLVASLGLAAFGVRQSALFVVFAGLGVFLAVGQLRFWLATPVKMGWWYEHMTNMLTSCIATVTAFLVVNVPRLGIDRYAFAFWVGPGIVGGIGITVWQIHYRRKFAAATEESGTSARGSSGK